MPLKEAAAAAVATVASAYSAYTYTNKPNQHHNGPAQQKFNNKTPKNGQLARNGWSARNADVIQQQNMWKF